MIEIWISYRAQNALHVRHLPKQFTVVNSKTSGLPKGWFLERVRGHDRFGCTLYRVSLPTAAWLKAEAEAQVTVELARDGSSNRVRTLQLLIRDLELMRQAC